MLLVALHCVLWYGAVPLVLLIVSFALLNQVVMGICRCSRNMTGKVAIVTGSNTGMGYETALELARRGCRVYLACRSGPVPGEPDPDAETVPRMKRESGSEEVRFRPLDVSLTASVEAFAERFQEEEDRLDVLVNNAGMVGRGSHRRETEEGLELVTATNYIGPFLLTKLLLAPLRRANGRVVNISSVSNTWARKDVSDLNLERSFPGPYQLAWVYARSKLFLAIFTKELAEREPSISAASVSPGVVATMISRDLIGLSGAQKMVTTFKGLWGFLALKTPWQGAQTAIHVALAPEVASGAHYADCRAGGGYLAAAVGDAEKRRRLWEDTEELLKKARERAKTKKVEEE